jgi:hypothetical protein
MRLRHYRDRNESGLDAAAEPDHHDEVIRHGALGGGVG